MKTSVLKSVLSALFCLLFFLRLTAQENHYIYLQTENKQPFYLKLDKKLLSSSSSGYLIIPRLTDGTYAFTIGFLKNELPEQTVTCTVNKKDEGFVLKNFGDKGWGLSNFQTQEVIMLNAMPVEKKNIVKEEMTEEQKDEFSSTLSSVVKDPLLTRKIISTETKPEIAITPVVKEADPVALALSKITKLKNETTVDGIEAVYVDITGGKNDTIRLFIPSEKMSTVVAVNITPEQKKAITDSKIKDSNTPVADKKAVVVNKPVIKETVIKGTDSKIIDSNSITAVKKPVIKTDKPVPSEPVTVKTGAKATDSKIIDSNAITAVKKPIIKVDKPVSSEPVTVKTGVKAADSKIIDSNAIAAVKKPIIKTDKPAPSEPVTVKTGVKATDSKIIDSNAIAAVKKPVIKVDKPVSSEPATVKTGVKATDSKIIDSNAITAIKKPVIKVDKPVPSEPVTVKTVVKGNDSKITDSNSIAVVKKPETEIDIWKMGAKKGSGTPGDINHSNTDSTGKKPVAPIIAKKDIKAPVTPQKPLPGVTKTATVSIVCKNIATDDDFFRLRKIMASFISDDDMIMTAKRSFKLKCFTTEQVKNLSFLFLKDEARYHFLDTAYPFVFDTENFGTLETLLTDSYYINRFKAMIRQ
jgi:Domain of unknown function (DUF4476)